MAKTLASLACCLLLRDASAEGSGFCDGDAPQHTGYLNAGDDAEYFYYFATSRSPTPNSDPLMLWMTGGPGCSSTYALLTENGPCSVEGKEADGTWKMKTNPYSWTELANVIWIDQPVGVGFSSHGSEVVATEKAVAERMFKFMQNFYVRYPQYLNVPLYITGESYGGHYVPAVAARVLRGQGDGVGVLKAISVGNGMVDPAIQWASKPVMAYTAGGGSLGHGVVNESIFFDMVGKLGQCEKNSKKCGDHPETMECLMTLTNCTLDLIMPVMATGLNPYDMRKSCAPPKIDGGNHAVGLNCYNTSTETAFLNDAVTKKKLGVPEDRAWKECNLSATIPFIASGDEFQDYRGAVLDLLAGGVQVLIYAGDTDFMVDWVGCKNWVEQLPWKYQNEWALSARKPIMMDGNVSGFLQTYHGLSFIQVFNAGHMMPMDQPKFALEMMRDLVTSAAKGVDLAEDLHSTLTQEQRSMLGAGIVAVLCVSMLVGFATKVTRHQNTNQEGTSYQALLAA